MPTIQSRDCPQELYDRLSQCAQEDHRSISQERTARLERRREVFKCIDAMPRVDIPEGFPTIEEMVREDRDSR